MSDITIDHEKLEQVTFKSEPTHVCPVHGAHTMTLSVTFGDKWPSIEDAKTTVFCFVCFKNKLEEIGVSKMEEKS